MSLADFGVAEKAKWWSADTVAVVTGANKGIGWDIAKNFAALGFRTVLTARNEELGREAMQRVKEATGSKNVSFLRLDIADPTSVKHFVSQLESTLGGITVLVNNAGIASKGNAFSADLARQTLGTNYYGTRAVCEAVAPLLTSNARIVNVCSRAGKLGIVRGELRERFESARSAQEIDALAEQFAADVEAGRHSQAGWPNSMYGVSKLCEATYTRALAAQLAPRGVAVTACCPGYVATDMSSWRGHKTTAEGADTPTWLALRAPGSPSGGFFSERRQEPY